MDVIPVAPIRWLVSEKVYAVLFLLACEASDGTA